jgi:hypothetical protein
MGELLATLRSRGDVPSQIKAMTQEITTLRTQLAQWVEQTAESGQRETQQIASELIRCWHRPVAIRSNWPTWTPPSSSCPPYPLALTTSPRSAWTTSTSSISPRLTAVVPSLERLHIRSSPQLHASSLFEALQHAPKLRELRVEGCLLLELPDSAHQVLPKLTELEALSLRRNELTLSAVDLQAGQAAEALQTGPLPQRHHPECHKGVPLR